VSSSSNTAVTATAVAGIVNVVVALFALARVTPVAVQFLNFLLAGIVAVMLTVSPVAYSPLPVPPVTVTAYCGGGGGSPPFCEPISSSQPITSLR
jgi:hypothetical protein